MDTAFLQAQLKAYSLARQWWALRMLGLAEAAIGFLVLCIAVTLFPVTTDEHGLGSILSVLGVVLIVSGIATVFSTRDPRIHPVTLVLIWLVAAAVAPALCGLWIAFALPLFAGG